MAYTKNTWATDDIITADKLNNIEDGVSNSLPLTQVPNGTNFDDLKSTGTYVTATGQFPNSPAPSINNTYRIDVFLTNTFDIGQRVELLVSTTINTFVRVRRSGIWSAWQLIAKDADVVKLVGDQTVSGNKTFLGTTTTTGYLKQKRWSTTASIGGNTFILNRIGDVVFASGQVTTVLTGETTASGTLTTGFRPYANFVINTNRGIGTGTLLFQQDGSVWVPTTVNVASYISGTYLAEDTLPTI